MCEYFFSVQIHNVFLQKVNCSFVIVLLPYQSDSTYYRFGVLFFMAVVVMDNIDVCFFWTLDTVSGSIPMSCESIKGADSFSPAAVD